MNIRGNQMSQFIARPFIYQDETRRNTLDFFASSKGSSVGQEFSIRRTCPGQKSPLQKQKDDGRKTEQLSGQHTEHLGLLGHWIEKVLCWDRWYAHLWWEQWALPCCSRKPMAMNWLIEFLFMLIVDGEKGKTDLTTLIQLDINLHYLESFTLELLNRYSTALGVL